MTENPTQSSGTRRTVAPQQSGGEVATLHQERTPEDGVIRLERWPEGYVLWHHGSVAWRSFRRTTNQ